MSDIEGQGTMLRQRRGVEDGGGRGHWNTTNLAWLLTLDIGGGTGARRDKQTGQ